MTKVILFDLGEVVFTNDWHYDCPEKFAAYTQYFGISHDEMEKGWNAAWPQYELGAISEDAFWKKFLTEAGAKSMDIGKAKALWRKYFAEKPGMLALLAELKEKYTLAVASSTGEEWLAYKKETYHLDDYFSDYFTTWEFHIKKAEKEFFQRIIQKLGVLPEEILLVDDTQKVLDVAQSEGIQTVLFDTPERFRIHLQELGLL